MLWGTETLVKNEDRIIYQHLTISWMGSDGGSGDVKADIVPDDAFCTMSYIGTL